MYRPRKENEKKPATAKTKVKKERAGKFYKNKYFIIAVVAILSAAISFFLVKFITSKPKETEPINNNDIDTIGEDVSPNENEPNNKDGDKEEPQEDILTPITAAVSSNCTIPFGKLMLINPNFMVEDDFISTRKTELISLNDNYGIQEYHSWNGDNLMDAEAAAHLNEMLTAYKDFNPGHELMTVSCFRSVGTSCGRLCMPTGASDHHTGLTCDLIDPEYGGDLDTDTYDAHVDWQWLRENSYKYGFINRFPEEWGGGPMSEPMNIDASGSTGLFETWHYRYVGIEAATEIATGKYNNGAYDSLEHYLLARGLVTDLVNGICK